MMYLTCFLWTSTADGDGYKSSPPHGETLCPNLAVISFLCAAVNLPVQGNSHVAPPDGVPAQENASADSVSRVHTDWPVQHEQSLLPVCRLRVRSGVQLHCCTPCSQALKVNSEPGGESMEKARFRHAKLKLTRNFLRNETAFH